MSFPLHNFEYTYLKKCLISYITTLPLLHSEKLKNNLYQLMLSPYSNISSYLKNILTQYIFWNLKYKAVCNKSLNDIPILQYQYGYS